MTPPCCCCVWSTNPLRVDPTIANFDLVKRVHPRPPQRSILAVVDAAQGVSAQRVVKKTSAAAFTEIETEPLNAVLSWSLDLAALDRRDFFGDQGQVIGFEIGFVKFIWVESGKEFDLHDEVFVVNRIPTDVARKMTHEMMPSGFR